MNSLTAPYFVSRSKTASRSQFAVDLSPISRTPEEIHELLKSSLPTISNDSVEISEVARRRAQGQTSWVPTANNYQRLLHAREQINERKSLADLRRQDASVRRRLWKQSVSGGELVRGPPDLNYQVGSDHRLYTVDGSISIDTSPVTDDAIATRRKARRVRNAYLASLTPPTSDHRSARSAISMGINAGIEIREPQFVSNERALESTAPAASPTPTTSTEAQTPDSVRTEGIKQYERVASNQSSDAVVTRPLIAEI